MNSFEADFGRRAEFYTFAPESLDEAIPDYDILREVGKGSMGVVYEAKRHTDEARVAIKLLPPSLTLTERALARFLREAELMRKISHPGIARVFDVGKSGKLNWFVMEFVDGQTLGERLRVGPLPVKEAVRIALEAARALHYAHSHGIVHRDIKPENLILRSDGGVSITDFGLARETGTGSMTESGAIVGTPMFMAPEQVLGERASVGARTDVYGLGSTLYTLLAGVPPFDGPTAQAVLKQVLEKAPAPLRRHRGDVPTTLRAIVHKAMERQVHRRYASCAEFADDLEAFLDGTKVQARLPSAFERARRTAVDRPIVTGLVAITIALSVTALLLLDRRREQRIANQLQEAELLLRRASGTRDALGQELDADERRRLLDQAIAQAGRIASAEDAAPAWFLLGRAAHLDRRYAQAAAHFDRAEAVYGRTSTELLHYRIDCLRHLDDELSRQRLLEDLQTLLDQDPGRRSRALVAAYLLDIGEKLDGQPRQEVLASIDSILPNVEDDADVAISRARLTALRGESSEAIALIRDARRDWPRNPLVQRAAARLFEQLGLPRESEDAAEIARILDPEAREDPKPQSVDIGAMGGFLETVERLVRGAREASSQESGPADEPNDETNSPDGRDQTR
ncbi:MAG: serine/threonine-protein kinase [Planctomycetota bacterium]